MKRYGWGYTPLGLYWKPCRTSSGRPLDGHWKLCYHGKEIGTVHSMFSYWCGNIYTDDGLQHIRGTREECAEFVVRHAKNKIKQTWFTSFV